MFWVRRKQTQDSNMDGFEFLGRTASCNRSRQIANYFSASIDEPIIQRRLEMRAITEATHP